MIYSTTTKDIKVTVLPAYIEEISSPEEGHYVWGYTIYIGNDRKEPVQLLSRHWRIIDKEGSIKEVKGEGVVGKKPVLSPKESFEYSSQVYLSCPSGIMMGSYQMIVEKTGEKFEVDIPAFSLDVPDSQAMLH